MDAQISGFSCRLEMALYQGEYQVKHNLMLTITSLLSILFMTLHLTSDTVHARVGTAEAGGSTLVAVPILVVWLYGTLVLAERRSGYIIMLVGSLLASGMPVIHVMGAGGVFRGQIAKSSPAFLFVWTLHALGVTGIFSLILSARGLWSLRRSQPRSSKNPNHGRDTPAKFANASARLREDDGHSKVKVSCGL